MSILLLGIAAVSSGQQLTLSGYLIDEKGVGIEQASVRIAGFREQRSRSDKKGFFRVELPADRTYTLRITALGKKPITTVVSLQKSDYFMGKLTLQQQQLGTVEIRNSQKSGLVQKIPTVAPGRVPSVSGNFEDFLKSVALGVASNNELTASYNVRGGNYDENLIYINGVEIYRPFLVRSGQQEGLSFIHSPLVEDIFFSAGGFDAYYGDKLSSVLDIRYREPTQFGGSAQASLMGFQGHLEGTFAKKRGNYLVGTRYRANSYLLNSLPTKGDYNPTFFDAQLLANVYSNYDHANRYSKWFVLGHYSSNNYRFVPTTRNTTWGTVNEALQLKVFFDGQEETRFQTVTAATGWEWKRSKNLKMNVIGSVFRSLESENFDILGQYWINELETDPKEESFGDSTENIGVGAFLDHARNDLDVWIGNVYTTGRYDFPAAKRTSKNGTISRRLGTLRWGAKAQYEQFDDRLSEWRLIDSAGYSIPLGDPDLIELSEVIKQRHRVNSYRLTGHLHYAHHWIRQKDKRVRLKKRFKKDSSHSVFAIEQVVKNSPAKWSLSVGNRGGYRSYNDEYWMTPRVSLTYMPRMYLIQSDSSIARRNVKWRLASGLYYQPPLYRTMRGVFGEIAPDVVSQKSWHNVVGADVYFTMWNRPFKFVAEAYYKYLWDVVPYEIDNVRIRYYGENNAVAYAYGLDAQIHGQFVKGVESFFKVGFLRTAEDILDDAYSVYFNSDGEKIIAGFTDNDVPVDSTRYTPGFIPRPTDQALTFSLFFQDRMPRLEQLKTSVNLLFGTPIPYGPPTYERYKDVLRSRTYFRVDMGVMYDFISDKQQPSGKVGQKLKWLRQLTLSFDVFNLLGIDNVISYQWLQDIRGRYYAIPNYLTGRRLNARLVVSF